MVSHILKLFLFYSGKDCCKCDLQLQGFTIEELNDVSEVHVILQDDVPVHLHQCQCNEEHEVTGRDMLCCPDGFPDCKHVIIHQLCETKQINKKLTCISVQRFGLETGCGAFSGERK